MPASPNSSSINRSSRFLHWTAAALMVLIYATMEFRGWFPRGGSVRAVIIPMHHWFGLSMLLLLALRLGLRWRRPFPAIAPTPPAWLRVAAHAGHFALYAFLLLMPLLGWAIVSAEGRLPSLLGWSLPALIAPDRELAHQLEELHELGATIGYYLIGGHVIAALWHHFRLRDNTLLRMRG